MEDRFDMFKRVYSPVVTDNPVCKCGHIKGRHREDGGGLPHDCFIKIYVYPCLDCNCKDFSKFEESEFGGWG